EAGGGKCRGDGEGNGTGIGVKQQDQPVDEIARRDHRLDLAALFHPARQDSGRRRFWTWGFELCRDRIQEWRRCAHCPAMKEISGKNLRGKAFRFGIFWNPTPATLRCWRTL